MSPTPTPETSTATDEDQTAPPETGQQRPAGAKGGDGTPTPPAGSQRDDSSPDEDTQDEDTQDGEKGGRGNREAARYRTQLREAETERDALATRIERLQRREVESLATDLAAPEDLFTIGGTALADVLDDEGDVDPDRVAEAVRGLLATRPGLHVNARPHNPDMGQGSRGGRLAAGKTTWDQFMKP